MTASVVLLDRRGVAPDPNWRLRLDSARRHTKFVKSFKLLLALGILALGGSVGFFIVMSAVGPPPAIDPTQVGGSVRMTNPRFTGRDAGGTPFVITAQSAERPESTATATELSFPRLDFAGEAESPAGSVEAERGVYDQAAGTLDLLDGVSFSTSDGYRFESEHARWVVDDGRVVGDRVVMGEGPLGSIRAQSFEIRENGESVVFTGNVVARLYPDREPDAEPRAEPNSVPGDRVDPPAAVDAPEALAPDDPSSPTAQTDDAAAAEPTAELTAETAAEDPDHAQLSRQGGPIDIAADSTEFITSENVNRWIGQVRVSQGDSQLTADAMDVYFIESPDGNAREIDRIEVDGSVVYTTPMEIALGDHGVFLASTQEITLTGDVTLIRGDSRLSGAELVVEPQAGRSTLNREAASDNGGRVRGVLGSATDDAAPPQPSDSD